MSFKRMEITFAAVLTATVLVFSGCVSTQMASRAASTPAAAAATTTQTAPAETQNQLVAELIYYFQQEETTGGNYSAQIAASENKLGAISPAAETAWKSAEAFWRQIVTFQPGYYADKDANGNLVVDKWLVDNWLKSNTGKYGADHVFVVLGYNLLSNSQTAPENAKYIGADGKSSLTEYDGTIEDNSENGMRLATGLAAAQANPGSYIAVSGYDSGNAAHNSGFTEGGEMKKWLVAKGFPADHIIFETTATNTVQNAQNTCKMIYQYYPKITSMTVISSKYHVRRSLGIFSAANTAYALSVGQKPIAITDGIGCTGTYTGGNSENLASLWPQIASAAGVSTDYNALAAQK